MDNDQKTGDEKEQSFFGIIVHSFFIIPFLIAVFCLLLFASVKLLTSQQQTAYDLLEDVKIGGMTKRWQAAFELSKILANPDLVPDDSRFFNELTQAYQNSGHDDPRVRQYLALAMGRTQKEVFVAVLTDSIDSEKEQNLPAIIYALGMLGSKPSRPALEKFLDHQNPRIRSIAAVAIGNLKDDAAIPQLRKALGDTEANVQWGAAISLAALGNHDGVGVISKLLDRKYLGQFSEVTPQEQTQLILNAIEASQYIKDTQLTEAITQLSQTDQNMKVRAAAFAYLAQ